MDYKYNNSSKPGKISMTSPRFDTNLGYPQHSLFPFDTVRDPPQFQADFDPNFSSGHILSGAGNSGSGGMPPRNNEYDGIMPTSVGLLS